MFHELKNNPVLYNILYNIYNLLFIRPAVITLNHLTPNDPYRGRTAPLTSKRCILYIYQQVYVLNILNMVYTLCFFLFKMQFVS